MIGDTSITNTVSVGSVTPFMSSSGVAGDEAIIAPVLDSVA